MVPTFSDWQISLTFPVLKKKNSSILFSVLFNEFNKYNLFNEDTSIKK